jgi:DNA replicative helicase MCM subunit Mcm2 (Cdc46/Mcm family)
MDRHVLEVHRAATQRNEVQEDGEREEAFFKRYLEYCRAKVSPRLSEAAADSLVSQYVELREQVISHTVIPPLGQARQHMPEFDKLHEGAANPAKWGS